MVWTVSPAVKAIPCRCTLGCRQSIRQSSNIWGSRPHRKSRLRRIYHDSDSNANSETEVESDPSSLDPDALQSNEFLSSLAACDNVNDVVYAIDNATRTLDRLDAESGSQLALHPESVYPVLQELLTQGRLPLAEKILAAMINRESTVIEEPPSKTEKNDQQQLIVWRWEKPDARCYAYFVAPYAKAMTVSKALKALSSMLDVAMGRPGNAYSDSATALPSEESSAEDIAFSKASDLNDFGEVIPCPCGNKGITLVRPDSFRQIVVCSNCNYEYEVITGVVDQQTSEQVSNGQWKSFLAQVVSTVRDEAGWFSRRRSSQKDRGIFANAFKFTPAAGAVHEILVLPQKLVRAGVQSGTFAQNTNGVILKFATTSNEVPAVKGDRVSAVLASSKRPLPGAQSLEPLLICKHTGLRKPVTSIELLRPPDENDVSLTWSRWIGLTTLFVASEAGSSFINSDLPPAIFLMSSVLSLSFLTSRSLLLPKLRKVTKSREGMLLAANEVRQKLYTTYSNVVKKKTELLNDLQSDIYTLARLYSLESKMETVQNEKRYASRLDRVKEALIALNKRLQSRLELLMSYGRIAAMVEIEVEMESDMNKLEESVGLTAEEGNLAQDILREMEATELKEEVESAAFANEQVDMLIKDAYQ